MRLIDADALKKAFNAESIFYAQIDAIIDESPTIDVTPDVRGSWVVLKYDEKSGCDIYGCGKCLVATGISKPDWKFCPICGAKMEGQGK